MDVKENVGFIKNVGFNSSHLVYINGDCGEVVNAPDCEFGIHGFDPHQSPIFIIIGI